MENSIGIFGIGVEGLEELLTRIVKKAVRDYFDTCEEMKFTSNEYLTIEQTCKVLGGITRQTLNNMRKSGVIKPYQGTRKGRVLYKREELLNLNQNHK